MSNVPAGASSLLDFIGKAETGREGDPAYRTIIGHHEDTLPKPVTEMTLDELEAIMPEWSKKWGSSAAGKYEIMRNTLDAPGTLRDLEGELGLTGTELFDPPMQDRLAVALLKRRGWDKFVAGMLSRGAFALSLSREWASLPVLSATKGAHKSLKRGDGYYDGDGINGATVTPEAFEAALDQALKEARAAVPATTGPAAFPEKGARNDEVVAQVQRRLRELGYSEVGNVDGDFGAMTEKAILLFRHDAGLPLNGNIDSSLIVALAKAAPRPLPQARTEATSADVRARVPELHANWLAKIWAGIMGAGTLGAAAIQWLIGNFNDARSSVAPIAALFGAVPIWGWLLLIAAGFAFVWTKSHQAERSTVAAYQAGERR